MRIKYFKQKPAKNFVILDRINVIYSTAGGSPSFQIKPFNAKVGDQTYEFQGLSAGIWTPVSNSCILAELDENGAFFLTAIPPDMIAMGLPEKNTILGVILYINDDEISILNHSEDKAA